VVANEINAQTWDAMDVATFQMLKDVLSGAWPSGILACQPDRRGAEFRQTGACRAAGPGPLERRIVAVDRPTQGPVREDYRPHHVENVYITRAG
jgi:hypothetical protein